MLRSRSTVLLVVVGLVAAAVPVAFAAHTFLASAASPTIAVTVGTPLETTLKVAPAKITVSPAVFADANIGEATTLVQGLHEGEHGRQGDRPSTCTGVATKKIAPGKPRLADGEVPGQRLVRVPLRHSLRGEGGHGRGSSS